MKYTYVSSSSASVNSSKLTSLLRQVAKKFYLKKTSCLHRTSEEFMSDTWSDRIRIEFHGLSIVLESWFWNGEGRCDLYGYYNGEKIQLLFDEELEKYARIILWYLSEYDFRGIYRYPLFKEEIAEYLGLEDEVKKFKKQSKKVHDELMNWYVFGIQKC